MFNAIPPKSSTRNAPLFEKSSSEALSFVDFILTLRVYATARGDLVALLKTLINADAFPTIAAWSDLIGLMRRRNARPEAIDTARKLWREFQKSQPAVSPANPRRIDHGRH
jgi:hypothetical protein